MAEIPTIRIKSKSELRHPEFTFFAEHGIGPKILSEYADVSINRAWRVLHGYIVKPQPETSEKFSQLAEAIRQTQQEGA